VRFTSAAAVSLVVVLSLARAAAAQGADSRPEQQLKISAAVWSAAVAADHVTTFQFRSKYPTLLHEQNPLVRGLEEHPAWLVSVNSAIDASTGWAVYKFLGTRHPRLATLAFYGAAAYRTYLSVHNVRMMNKARALSSGFVR